MYTLRNNQQDIREMRQNECVEAFYKQEILVCAPRFGKILTTIKIMKKLENPRRVLISYPENPIKQSWENDFKKWGYKPEQVIYVNFSSIHKYINEPIDLLVVDEIHSASDKELRYIGKITATGVKTVALTGTLTRTKEDLIYFLTGLVPIYRYSIEQAVEEGILADYTIHIHKVALSGTPCGRYKDKKGNPISEKKKFDSFSWVARNRPNMKHIMELKMIDLIQKSISKKNKTIQLLQQFQNQRTIVFCGLIETADSLGIPSYHSKSKDEQLFNDFCAGTGQAIALVNIGGTGTTIRDINKGIINYNTGAPATFTQRCCRLLGTEIQWPDKKAELHYIVSNEPFELERLSTCTMWFDKSKIFYV